MIQKMQVLFGCLFPFHQGAIQEWMVKNDLSMCNILIFKFYVAQLKWLPILAVPRAACIFYSSRLTILILHHLTEMMFDSWGCRPADKFTHSLKNIIVYFPVSTWIHSPQGDLHTSANKEKNSEINTYMYVLQQKSCIWFLHTRQIRISVGTQHKLLKK